MAYVLNIKKPYHLGIPFLRNVIFLNIIAFRQSIIELVCYLNVLFYFYFSILNFILKVLMIYKLSIYDKLYYF